MKRILFLAIIVFTMGFQPVTTDSVTSAWTTLCNVGSDRIDNLTFHVKNTGSTNPFTDCKVQVFTGPLSTDWEDLDLAWTKCLTLAAGAKTTWAISGNSYLRLRVQAKSASGTSAYCKPTGDK